MTVTTRSALITAEAVREVAPCAKSRAELLRLMGVTASTSTYARLESIATQHGLAIPSKMNRGKPGPRRGHRRSPMWDKERLANAITDATSVAEVLDRLGLSRHARAQLVVATREAGLKLPDGRLHRGRKLRQEATLRVLVKGKRRIPGYRLRWYMLSTGIFSYICAECGQLPEWNGKVLVLQVDHVNGDPTDNQPRNLQFLCPNCHTQTETFAGRNCSRKSMGNGVNRQHA